MRPNMMIQSEKLSDDARFQQLCTQIQSTDEISFKLLGLVPLLSAAGIAGIFLKAEPLLSPVVYLVSIFAGILTLALFIWERRNIEICKWLRERAGDLEARYRKDPCEVGHFVRFPKATWGKTEAEKIVYVLTTFTWLGLPWLVDLSLRQNGQDVVIPSMIFYSHTVITVLVSVAVIKLAFAPIEPTPAPVEVDDKTPAK